MREVQTCRILNVEDKPSSFLGGLLIHLCILIPVAALYAGLIYLVLK